MKRSTRVTTFVRFFLIFVCGQLLVLSFVLLSGADLPSNFWPIQALVTLCFVVVATALALLHKNRP